MPTNAITNEHFHLVDIRVGQVLQVEDNTKAKKPAYVLTIDFGAEIGIKLSSAQLTLRYGKDKLIGKQVLGVVKLPSRQIGDARSEVLVLAAVFDQNGLVLVGPVEQAPNGARIL